MQKWEISAVNGGPFANPLVSVIVNNYNYERFLHETINSALKQSYPNTEVIVVDDGSTDTSRQIIKSYGNRVIPVLKENGGQASACNAGFRMSRGEIVTFLDADDVLLPNTVQRVVAAFQASPDAVRIQYRQQVIDAQGTPTGKFHPASHVKLPSGDLRKHILELHSHFFPTMSGNAFVSSVLRRILPIPENLYRICADIYLCNVSAVLGPVVSLDEVGTLYRVHGKNHFYTSISSTNLALVRKELLALDDSYARQVRLLNAYYDAEVKEIGSRDLYFLSARMVSLKLDPKNHPLKDNLLPLCVNGCVVSITQHNPELYRGTRLFYVLWFVAMLLTPRAYSQRLAQIFFYRERRKWLYDRLLSVVRKIR